MEYPLDKDYLVAKNKRSYHAVLIGGFIVILVIFFVMRTVWLVPFIILLIVALGIKSKHKKSEADASQHKVTVNDGVLTIHWPGAYSCVKSGELNKLSTVTKDNALKAIKIFREDGQINILEGYQGMPEMLEEIRRQLNPGEIVEG